MAQQTTIVVPAADGQGASVGWSGGWATVAAFRTFDSGAVTLQASYDGGTTWLTVPDVNGTDAAFTADGIITVALGGSPLLRASLAGSSGSTAVTLVAGFGFSPQYLP